MGHNFDYCGVSGCKVCGQPPCDSCKVLEDVAERLDKKLGEEYIKTMSLRARIEVLEKVVEYAEHHPGCGYTFDHVTQTGELVGCTCGLEAALDAAKEGK